MRVMALDLGEKRTGVALSDEGRILATPFEVVVRPSFAQLLARLQQIVVEQHVTQLLIGYPLNMDGSIGPQAERVRQQAKQIEIGLQLPVTLWDEKLSSVEAEQIWQANHPKRRTRQGRQLRPALDAIAAAILLQAYLDAQNNTNPKE